MKNKFENDSEKTASDVIVKYLDSIYPILNNKYLITMYSFLSSIAIWWATFHSYSSDEKKTVLIGLPLVSAAWIFLLAYSTNYRPKPKDLRIPALTSVGIAAIIIPLM